MAKRQSSTFSSSKFRAGVLCLLTGVALATSWSRARRAVRISTLRRWRISRRRSAGPAFYVGANLGGGWANGSLNDNFTGASIGTGSSGVVGGGKAGYNYQIGNFVLGAEWDFEGSSLNTTRSSGVLPGLCEHQLDHDGGRPLRHRRRQLALLRQGRRRLGRQQRDPDQPRHRRFGQLVQHQWRMAGGSGRGMGLRAAMVGLARV